MLTAFDEGGIARLAHKFLTLHAPSDKDSALMHLRSRLGVYDTGGHTLINAVDSYFKKAT